MHFMFSFRILNYPGNKFTFFAYYSEKLVIHETKIVLDLRLFFETMWTIIKKIQLTSWQSPPIPVDSSPLAAAAPRASPQPRVVPISL